MQTAYVVRKLGDIKDPNSIVGITLSHKTAEELFDECENDRMCKEISADQWYMLKNALSEFLKRNEWEEMNDCCALIYKYISQKFSITTLQKAYRVYELEKYISYSLESYELI